jgi:hypothetical protein
MSTGPADVETTTILRGFPIWPGLFVGLAVVFGLVSLPLPQTLVRVLGGPMAWVHGIIAFAIVTLLGEALTIARWDRALGEWLDGASEPDAHHPRSDDSGGAAVHAEVEQTVREFLQRWQETRRIIEIVPYIVPLIGFGVSSWNSGLQGPWRIVGQPLLLSVSEAFFVVLLTIGVSGALDVVKDGWLLLVK